MLDSTDRILYRQVKSVKIGQSERFKISYNPSVNATDDAIPLNNIWVKIKNTQMIALRAAYLAGPYVLYVDCKSEDYSTNEKYFITADQPVFEPQLLPGQSFYVELSCHTLKPSYCWVVDVVSQIIFNNTIEVDFEITIGTSKKILHDSSFPEKRILNSDKTGLFVNPSLLHVHNLDTFDLWNLPLHKPQKKVHLVILTHGLHSNVSADMLYLKEEVDKKGVDNVVVKGFFGNLGKTERGIKYLGSRVAEYVVELVKSDAFEVDKISFIGHSLGGLIQTFAIAYLHINFPWFFQQIQPINFITLASPLLGIVNENPLYVKLALLAGIVGITGQDLGLKFVEKDAKPLLVLLPTGPTHTILKKFKRRTVYANAVNDGLVPLRTSALLYLDYKGVFKLFNSKEQEQGKIQEPEEKTGRIPPEAGEPTGQNEEPEETRKIPQEAGEPTGKIPKNVFSEESNKFLVQGMLTYFMPQKQQKPDAVYGKFQTNSGNVEDPHIDGLPTSTFFDAIPNLVLPPLPTMKYITDPSSREDVILHDKVYREDDLPPHSHDHEKQLENKLQNLRKRILETIDNDVEHLEEEIAREYHKSMTWRKVIVKLKPDAHNNILVRRRFANAYGWPVIEHLVNNHFSEEEQEVVVPSDVSIDSLDSEIDLASIVGRDTIKKLNSRIEEDIPNEEGNHQWVNTKEGESFFAVGPTGLLADVSEMVGAMRDHWYNMGTTSPAKPSTTPKKEDHSNDDIVEITDKELDITDQIMGGYTY